VTGTRLVECAIPMTACDNPELHYRLGISLFVAGVEAVLARGEVLSPLTGKSGPGPTRVTGMAVDYR